MTHTNSRTHSTAAARENETDDSAPVVTSRLDGPHMTGHLARESETFEAEEAALLAAAGGHSADPTAEQMLDQAQELAAHLRERQRLLDAAETQLNARQARIENEERSARLWSREKEMELVERQQQVAAREESIRQREVGVSAAELSTESELATRQVAVEAAERELRRQEDQIARHSENLTQRARELDELQHHILAEQERVLEDRDREERRMGLERDAAQRSFREAESLLGQHLKQLEQDRQQLQEERRQLLAESQDGRRALAERQKQIEQEWTARQQQLRERSIAVDARQRAEEELHADVARLHREALEMRLVTEQLWAQLTPRVPGPQLTQSVAQLRGQLAEHYRLANEQLARQREEAVMLGEQLETHQLKLRQQRQEIQDWANRRYEEIEGQAAQLVAREQQLDRQESEFKAAATNWQREREQLQNQIRRLSVQIQRTAAAA